MGKVQTIIYVVVDEDNQIYGITKDFIKALDYSDKCEKAYGGRFYITSETDLDAIEV